jgi:nicotinate phosphoribosyltransferase
VRIDSGDLAKLAVDVRNIFDEAGLKDIKIIGSGGLDEYDLADFSDAKIPYDSYGVGTKMGVSADAPWSDIAYKLVEYDKRPVLKLSTGKVSLPGKKQVFRVCDKQGQLRKISSLRGENFAGAEPLLKKVSDRRKDYRHPFVSGRDQIRFLVRVCQTSRTIKAIRNSAIISSNKVPELREYCAECRTASHSLTVIVAGANVKR